jgi:exodeoxyribonuclease VII large subunit
VTTDRATFTISQVNQAVGAALTAAFPDPFWVVGELQGYDRDVSKAATRPWGQVYFELAEKNADADSAKAVAKALMWGNVLRAVSRRLAESGAEVRLTDGLKVKFLCSIDFYWPRASLQLKVLDVDPDFTLGDLEKARRDLVDRLSREGLLELNKSVPMPPAPRVIGLITSEGSAAYHDFLQELRPSGFGFTVLLADARMQGEETESSVTAALSSLASRPEVEVIALVRGGGSRSDLMWFDREKIARAVARCSKPVITGIGHEIDLSVADLAAHASHKTPTACARFLVERTANFAAAVTEAASRTAREALVCWDRSARALSDAAGSWRRLSEGRLRDASTALRAAGPALVMGSRRVLDVGAARLASAGPRLARSSAAVISARRERLESSARELVLKDPDRLLSRGFTLVRAADGRLVKSLAQISVGETTTVRVRDGSFSARVTSKE